MSDPILPTLVLDNTGRTFATVAAVTPNYVNLVNPAGTLWLQGALPSGLVQWAPAGTLGAGVQWAPVTGGYRCAAAWPNADTSVFVRTIGVAPTQNG